MAAPEYFRWFPDYQYPIRQNKAGKKEYLRIKDYFRLLKVRDDIFREETLYSTYTIQNGRRPDQISYDMYEDEQFYWVILQINEIVDYYNEWPLDNNELEAFVYKKYGGVIGASETHHWETREVLDEATPPNILLEGGLVVPEDFIFYYPEVPGSSIELSESKPFPVSNMQYERQLNDAKSQILLLDKKYIYDYAREVQRYAESIEPNVPTIGGDYLEYRGYRV